ncbi:thioredoxin family protein, partial [Brevundimonas sp. UBA875]
MDAQPWSAAAVAEATSAGRPVLVNLTADWCVTCKINER